MSSTSKSLPSQPASAEKLRLPEFLIIGAAKSGTTSLYHYLCRHPRVSMGKKKEPCYFARDEVYGRGLAWYAELFDGAGEDQICGEASTDYTRWPEAPLVPERIKAVMPHVKLIYLMRHPVDRAYSHYVHRHTKELYAGEPFTRTFEQHVADDTMCLNSSLYIEQINRYLEHFPRESLLPLLTSDLADRPDEIVAQVCRFLEIETRDDLCGAMRANVASEQLRYRTRERMASSLKNIPGLSHVLSTVPKGVRRSVANWLISTPLGHVYTRNHVPPPMTPEMRQKYLAYFSDTVDAVENFLGRDLSAWRT